MSYRAIARSGEREARGTGSDFLDMLQTETFSKTLASVKVSEKERGKRKWQWLRQGTRTHDLVMAYHALTNWATESFSNSVTEFEYILKAAESGVYILAN